MNKPTYEQLEQAIKNLLNTGDDSGCDGAVVFNLEESNALAKLVGYSGWGNSEEDDDLEEE